MNREERLRFIDHELKGLWPDWEPTDAELRLWMGILTDRPYDPARRALQDCFCGPAGNYRRPKPAAFMEALRTLSACDPIARTAPQDTEPGIFIECIESPEGQPHVLGKRKPVNVLPVWRRDEVDYVQACAESLCK